MVDTRSNNNNNNLTSASNNLTSANVNLSNLKYPNFNPDNPDLFFQVINSYLSHYGVSEKEAFLNVFVNLPNQIQSLCNHLLDQSIENPISEFKKIIDLKFKLPIQDRLKKMLNSKRAEEMKPSEYLKYLRDTLGQEAETHEDMIRIHFLDSMPKNIGPFIRLLPDSCTVDIIAQAADKSYTNPEINAVDCKKNELDRQIKILTESINATTIQKREENTVNTFAEKISSQISALERQIEQANQNIAAMQRKLNYYTKNRNFTGQYNRSRSRSRDRRNFDDDNSTFCYYHKLYKNRAYKCQKPCSFNAQNSGQNSKNE